MKKIAKIIGALLIIFGLLMLIRFGLGGREDTWICQNGTWVKHGNPSQPQPDIPCEREGQTIEEISPTGTMKATSFEESRVIAENFAKNSPTYKFDGKNLKMEISQVLKCPYCWEFKFTYQSSHGGYGDRTGQILTQVITPHLLLVTVDQGEIASAVVDSTFDELHNRFIK